MQDLPLPRLRVRFLFLGRAIAWECARCHKLFTITAENALGNHAIDPPPEVSASFEQHDCGIVFAARLIETNPRVESLLRAAHNSDKEG